MTSLVAVAALVAVVIGTLALLGGDEPPRAASGPPSPALSVQPSHTPPAPTTVDVAGVELPVSAMHGPRRLDGGLASSFSNSEEGAALAALHLLMRTSATAGSDVFEPTITGQVAGPNAAVMKLHVGEQYDKLQHARRLPRGAPIDGADAQPIGYRIAAYTDRAATVDVVLSSPQLQETQRLLQFTVSLRWINDDWRVVAPPRGDWGSVAVPLGSRPAGLLDYADMG